MLVSLSPFEPTSEQKMNEGHENLYLTFGKKRSVFVLAAVFYLILFNCMTTICTAVQTFNHQFISYLSLHLLPSISARLKNNLYLFNYLYTKVSVSFCNLLYCSMLSPRETHYTSSAKSNPSLCMFNFLCSNKSSACLIWCAFLCGTYIYEAYLTCVWFADDWDGDIEVVLICQKLIGVQCSPVCTFILKMH